MGTKNKNTKKATKVKKTKKKLSKKVVGKANTSNKKATKKVAKKSTTKVSTKKTATTKKAATKTTLKPKLKGKASPTQKNTYKVKTKPGKKKSAGLSTQKIQSKSSKLTPPTGKMDWQEFFTPLDDRMLVQVQAKSSQTSGGIFIPDSVVESAPQQGTVLAVGSGHKDKKGHLRPMDVKAGDLVLFNEYTGSPLNLLGHEVVIMREQDILGIVE